MGKSARPSRPQLDDLTPYDAKEIKAEVILASNENPNNLPGEILAKLSARLPEFRFNRYPDPTAHELRRLIADANGLVVVCPDIVSALDTVDLIAPEHLEVQMAEPFDLLGSIRNAGAIFLGQWTPESVGDYVAGPNHVLPTGGTARFSSPLSVDDFVKKSSVLSYSFEALEMDGDTVLAIAEKEGLWAHGRAVSLRLEAVASFVDELDAEIAGSKRGIPAEALLDFDVLDDLTGDDLEDEDGGS